jgi:hypothetical protein
LALLWDISLPNHLSQERRPLLSQITQTPHNKSLIPISFPRSRTRIHSTNSMSPLPTMPSTCIHKLDAGNLHCNYMGALLPLICTPFNARVVLCLIARFCSHRGQLSKALATYSSLPGHYAPHMWTSLESFMLSQVLDIHADLNKPKDTEWIHVLLSYLKTYIENESELLMHEGDKAAYVTELVTGLKAAASEPETGWCSPSACPFCVFL